VHRRKTIILIQLVGWLVKMAVSTQTNTNTHYKQKTVFTILHYDVILKFCEMRRNDGK